MSNTVNSKWNRGNAPVPGTASTGYPFITMEWNQPVDDNNHDEILSPVMDFPFPGQAANILVNTEGATTAGDFVINVYGSTSNDATISKWEVLATNTAANANITGTTYSFLFDIDKEGLAPYMKIGLDPDSDPGAVDIRVAVITGVSR